jgi:hypothetical protein
MSIATPHGSKPEAEERMLNRCSKDFINNALTFRL